MTKRKQRTTPAAAAAAVETSSAPGGNADQPLSGNVDDVHSAKRAKKQGLFGKSTIQQHSRLPSAAIVEGASIDDIFATTRIKRQASRPSDKVHLHTYRADAAL